VRFLPSARIRLISALALHCVSLPRLDETPILRASCRYCQRWTAIGSARFRDELSHPAEGWGPKIAIKI
jgi:hypothetical protein